MPATLYNRVLFAAWLLVSAGAGWIYPPAGLIVAGLGLAAVLLLTLYLHRIGIRFASSKPEPSADEPVA